jgi:hypothetical protein
VNHTPAPWTWITDNVGQATLYGNDGGGPKALPCTIIARAALNVPHWPTEANAERSANASLISAAPELLAACKGFVALYGSHKTGDCTPPGCSICRCRAAIEKAEPGRFGQPNPISQTADSSGFNAKT